MIDMPTGTRISRYESAWGVEHPLHPPSRDGPVGRHYIMTKLFTYTIYNPLHRFNLFLVSKNLLLSHNYKFINNVLVRLSNWLSHIIKLCIRGEIMITKSANYLTSVTVQKWEIKKRIESFSYITYIVRKFRYS